MTDLSQFDSASAVGNVPPQTAFPAAVLQCGGGPFPQVAQPNQLWCASPFPAAPIPSPADGTTLQMSSSSEPHMLPWSHVMWQQQQQINMLQQVQQALLLGGTAGPRRARNRPVRPGRAERERQQHALQRAWSGAAAELGRADVSGSHIHDTAHGAGAAPQSKSDAESWCEVAAQASKVSLLPESVTRKQKL
eukprot:6437656-Amphidinium_carterae.1